MTKPKSMIKIAPRPSGQKNRKLKPHARPSRSSPKSVKRPTTKHDRVLSMLRSSGGATIASIMTATDWQQHSVRGFLAGVVRKKLKLNLVSEHTDKGRVYRIRDRKAPVAVADSAKQAA